MKLDEKSNNCEKRELKSKKGDNSRTRRELVRQAVNSCTPENRYNVYKVCEQLGRIMEERYNSDKKLDYQSDRMGMETTSKMLAQIDLYFWTNT